MTTITIGRSLVPLEHIAWWSFSTWRPTSRLQSDRQFQSRVVLLNRESVLTEQPWQEFAEAHGFRILSEDSLATNPAVPFRVQIFCPRTISSRTSQRLVSCRAIMREITIRASCRSPGP